MATSTEFRSTLIQTAKAFVKCYNVWTVEAVLSLRTENCKHTVLPASLNVPTYVKAEYGPFFAPFMALLTDVSLKIVDEEKLVVDTEKRKVVLHVKSAGKSAVGDYGNEYNWTLTMTEDGKMIEDIVEFVDSATAVEFFRQQAQMDV